MRLFPSRKAQTELTLQQIIGLVIAIVVVLASVGLFFSLMMLFVGPPDSGSIRTLDVMYEAMLSFDNPDNHNTSCYVRPIYIEEDWSIVGFNSDGVVAADNDFACHLGGDCIEEQCYHDDNIIKPGQCGNGPCLCLCDGGGDVDGDDCQESGAVCRKYSMAAGFDRFYWPDNSDCPGIMFSVPGRTGTARGLCDLVIPSESCGIVDQSNYNVRKSLVIVKVDRNSPTGKYQIFVERFDTERLEELYPEVDTDCAEMVENLRTFRAVTPGERLSDAEQQDAGDTVLQELEETGAAGQAGTGGVART